MSRKAGLALANAIFVTTHALVAVSRLGTQFDGDLADIMTRMDTLMKRPDLLLPWPNDPKTS